jgi:Winged helix DNA-binding domain
VRAVAVAVAAGEVSVTTSVVAVLAVTQEQARRFLVARQFLAPARSLTGVEGVLEVFRRFGSVQFDPVAVAGRSHDLVLHARVAGYRSQWCDDLYASREIVEATNKALSFVPVEEFPWFRHVMGRKGPTFHKTALADNAEVAARVLDRIRVQGPVSSSDFPSQSSRTKNWFGAPENAVRAALEALTVNGVIGQDRLRPGDVDLTMSRAAAHAELELLAIRRLGPLQRSSLPSSARDAGRAEDEVDELLGVGVGFGDHLLRHECPFLGLAHRVCVLLEHHARRADETVAVLEQNAQSTVWQIAGELT